MKSIVPSTTYTTTSPTSNNWLPNIHNWAIGFERQWDLLEQLHLSMSGSSTAYPPYNIIMVDEDEYIVEVALAGFKKKEIEIIQQEQTLTIKGTKATTDNNYYVHKGIGARSFTHTFALADFVEVEKAVFQDGILLVSLRRELPEDKKPRTIDVE